MAWTIVALRRIRMDLAPTLGVLVLVLATALIAALAPRVLASLADDAVRGAVAAAPAAARNIVLAEHTTLGDGPPGDPLAEVRAAGDALREAFPPHVEELVASQDAVVESNRFRLQKPTTDPAFIRFRIQEGIDDHIRYVEGRAPTATVETRDDVGPEALDGVPVFETGVSRATADRFGLTPGEVVELLGDPGDPLLGRTPQDAYAFARITGIYEVRDEAADFWLDDPLAIRPVIRALSSEVQLLDAALVVDPAAHAPLTGFYGQLGRPLRYTWRYFVDDGAITARSVPGLITAFRRLEVQYPSANVTAAGNTAMRTGLLELLQGFDAAWAAAESIVAVMAVGPALVALATLTLVAVLAARRRRATMGLARGRGASGGQVLLPTLVEGLVVAIPPAVLATVAAVLLVDGGRAWPSVAMAAAVVALAVAILVATVVPTARGLGPERQQGEEAVGRAGGRRLVVEVLVVALAAGAAYLLSERGVGGPVQRVGDGAAPAGGAAVGGFDPLIAAVPALVGIAAGIVAVRLYPLVMRGVSGLARRRRGLVPMLAARRASEGGGSAVLLVLLATATVGAFGAVALDSLDRGADLAAWNAVGASHRVEPPTGALPTGFDATTLPGVEAAATEFQGNIPLGQSGPQTLLVAVEAQRLAEVLAGTPVAPAYPPGFTEPGPGPIPAIIATSVAESPRGVKLGETFTMSVEGHNLTYRAAMAVDSFPGLPAGRGFVVVPREWIAAQAPAARMVPGVALVRAPAEAADAIRAELAATQPTLTVRSQAEDAEARRAAPVTGAVRSLILFAVLVTAAYAALGVAAALALAGLARALEVAHLRTLGLTARQSLALQAGEHGPTTLAAFVAGGLLGVGLFAFLRPVLGLGTLVGAPVEVPVVLDPPVLLVILVMMTAVVAFGLLLGAALQRRVAPVAALRGRSA
jgi:putative ABC transport system permease protein